LHELAIVYFSVYLNYTNTFDIFWAVFMSK
jgi:hypothetical protein